MKRSDQFIGPKRPISSVNSDGSKENCHQMLKENHQMPKENLGLDHKNQNPLPNRPKRCVDRNRKSPCRGRGRYGRRDIIAAYMEENFDVISESSEQEEPSGRFMPKLIYTADQKSVDDFFDEITDDTDLSERVIPTEMQDDSPGLTPVLLHNRTLLPYTKYYRNTTSSNEDYGCSPYQYFQETKHSGLYNLDTSICNPGPFYLPFGAESQLDVKGDNPRDYSDATEHFPTYHFLGKYEIVIPEKRSTCWKKDFKDLDELIAQDEKLNVQEMPEEEIEEKEVELLHDEEEEEEECEEECDEECEEEICEECEEEEEYYYNYVGEENVEEEELPVVVLKEETIAEEVTVTKRKSGSRTSTARHSKTASRKHSVSRVPSGTGEKVPSKSQSRHSTHSRHSASASHHSTSASRHSESATRQQSRNSIKHSGSETKRTSSKQ